MADLDLHNAAIARLERENAMLQALSDDPDARAIGQQIVDLKRARDNAQALATQWQAVADRQRKELEELRSARYVAERAVLKTTRLVEVVRDFAAVYIDDGTPLQQGRWAAVMALIGKKD